MTLEHESTIGEPMAYRDCNSQKDLLIRLSERSVPVTFVILTQGPKTD